MKKTIKKKLMNNFKTKKIFLFIFIFFILFFNINFLYSAELNLGFIESNIWYSKSSFVEGDLVKIYTLINNQENNIFSGKLNFYNNEILLGSRDFSLNPGESKIIDIEWKVTAGSNIIYAKIVESKILLENDKYQDILVKESESEKSNKIIIKKIPTVNEVTTNLKENIKEKGEPIREIQDNIVENTPEAISKPIIYSINNLDDIRENFSFKVDEKKDEVIKQIEDYKEKKDKDKDLTIEEELDNLENKEKTGDKFKEQVLSPFIYIKLFFLKLISFILNTKIIFYLIILIIIFFIFKLIYNRFF